MYVASILFGNKPEIHGKIFPRCCACSVSTWKKTVGKTLNVPFENQYSDSDKKQRTLKQRQTSFLDPPCHSQTLKLAPQIWLAGTRLEVREYPHDLRESVEYCQNISEISSNCLPRTCCAVAFAWFHPYLGSCHFNLCKRRCMYVVVDMFNEFVSRREVYCYATWPILSSANTFPRIYNSQASFSNT